MEDIGRLVALGRGAKWCSSSLLPWPFQSKPSCQAQRREKTTWPLLGFGFGGPPVEEWTGHKSHNHCEDATDDGRHPDLERRGHE